VEETTAASVALNDEAQTLKELVSRFRISGHPAQSIRNPSAALRATAQQMRAPAIRRPAPSAPVPTPARKPQPQSHGSSALARDDWEEF
jgi:methyl-accepting chemotaxis protein